MRIDDGPGLDEPRPRGAPRYPDNRFGVSEAPRTRRSRPASRRRKVGSPAPVVGELS